MADVIRLTAIPSAPYGTRRGGTVLHEAWNRTSSGASYPLLGALRKKGNRYGNQLAMPYVIAVSSFDGMLTDGDFEETLFGDPSEAHAVRASKDDGLTRGFWGTAKTPNHRRVSAVLFTKNLWPPTVLTGQVYSCLYLNPGRIGLMKAYSPSYCTAKHEHGKLRRFPGAAIHEHSASLAG